MLEAAAGLQLAAQVRVLRQGLESSPRNARLRVALAYALGESDAAESKALARDAAAGASADAFILYECASVLALHGEFDDAARLVEEASTIATRNNDRTVLEMLPYARGRIAEGQGRFDDAESAYREYYEAEPHESTRIGPYVTFLMGQGRRAEAQAVVDAAHITGDIDLLSALTERHGLAVPVDGA